MTRTGDPGSGLVGERPVVFVSKIVKGRPVEATFRGLNIYFGRIINAENPSDDSETVALNFRLEQICTSPTSSKVFIPLLNENIPFETWKRFLDTKFKRVG